MKKRKLLKRTVSTIIATVLIFSYAPALTYADDNSDNDPIVVVSLGDSYSSGEGLGDYYGSDLALNLKVLNEDWIAHRSPTSWPALIEIPGVDGTLKDYKNDVSNTTCQWYFRASSGATTENFTSEQGGKTICQKYLTPQSGTEYEVYESEGTVQPQFDVFDQIDETVDYVTLSIGGNDVGFSDIMFKAVAGSKYLGHLKNIDLAASLNTLWSNIGDYMIKLDQTYRAIHEKAPEADIIVAGYPKLLSDNMGENLISSEDAAMINRKVSEFNDKIEEVVNKLDDSMKIHFVDVEEAFEGHGAYSDDEWINGLILGYGKGDLDENELYSSGSFHPNSKGAKAYAECVNETIKEIEKSKHDEAVEEGAKTVQVQEVMSDNYMYLIITGYDDVGESVWTYQTDSAQMAELTGAHELGVKGEVYYIEFGCNLYAFKVSTGELLWKTDGVGAVYTYAFGDNGIIYCSGYYGPHFTAIDSNGNIVYQVVWFDEDIYWPSSMDYNGDSITIHFEEPYEEQPAIKINLTDYTYTRL